MKNRSIQDIANDIATLYPIPMPLNDIAEDEGLCVIYDDYDANTFDGMTWYEPGQDKFFIHLNTARGNTPNSNKGRFTLAHEFGHYFIDHHRNAMENGKMKPHIHRYSPFGKNDDWLIEREADEFAACLLMPFSRFNEDLRIKPFSGELIQQLANEFKVSFSACALRYMSLNLVPIMLVYAENGRIKWQMRSQGFPFYRLRYGTNSVPENTVLGDYFYKNDSSCSRQSEIVFAGDCFQTKTEEENRLQFYEYCITHEKYALSVFWC